MTSLNAEIFAVGAIARESSSVNRNGSSLTRARTTATGMREPSAGRANTNTESSGRTFAASAGLSVTVPLTLRPALTPPAAALLSLRHRRHARQ